MTSAGGARAVALKIVAALGVAILISAAWWMVAPEGRRDRRSSDTDFAASPTTTTAPIPPTTSTAVTTTTAAPYDGWVDPASTGAPFPNAITNGLLTFRGNPTRSYYGTGPVPSKPQVLWSYPESGGLCGSSNDGKSTQVWCGTGWNGQPSVWEYQDRTWVAFGAYDYGVHFLDAGTGTPIIPSMKTGDLAKGTVSVDPDGYPLLYHGSRDNYLRVVAFDRDEPEVLWRLNASDSSPVKWNNDWDASPLILDDYLFEGGENSRIHIVKLNRSYDAGGKVQVDPQLIWSAAGWDDELLQAIGDGQVSIENSVAISGNTLYFSNGGGLVQGWDISGLADGIMPTRTFRFWTGDDTDATISIDDEGMLYIGAEWERGNSRSRDLGQVIKLDPSKPEDPYVWGIKDQATNPAGIWATPAIYKDVLIVATNGGEILGINRGTGTVLWRKRLPGPTWQSPVVIEDVLIQGDCSGVLHGFDLSDTAVDPPELWTVQLEGCIESTPAVWQGRIYVGARGGKFYAIGDASPSNG